MLYIHIGPCFANKSRLNKFILTSKTSNSKDFRKCVDKKAKQKGEQNIVDASWLFMRNKRSYTAYVGFKLNSNNSTKPVHSHVHFDPCSSGNFHGIYFKCLWSQHILLNNKKVSEKERVECGMAGDNKCLKPAEKWLCKYEHFEYLHFIWNFAIHFSFTVHLAGIVYILGLLDNQLILFRIYGLSRTVNEADGVSFVQVQWHFLFVFIHIREYSLMIRIIPTDFIFYLLCFQCYWQ